MLKCLDHAELQKKLEREIKLHEEEKCQLLHKNATQKSIIEDLSKKYEIVCHDLIDHKAKEKTLSTIQEELHKSIGREQHLTLKLKMSEQKCESKDYEFASIKEELNKEQCENVRFINTLRRASTIIKQLQNLQEFGNESECNSEVHEKRQDLLDYLAYIFIFTSDSANSQTINIETLTTTDDMYRNADTDSEVNCPVTKISQYSFDEDTIEMVSFTKSADGNYKEVIKPSSACSIVKSEDEISEDIVEQEDNEIIDLYSHDFSKASELNVKAGSETSCNHNIIIQSISKFNQINALLVI